MYFIQNSSQAKEDTVTEVKEDDDTAPNVQMPDNIKLNFQYADAVYEMADALFVTFLVVDIKSCISNNDSSSAKNKMNQSGRILHG